MKRQTYDTAANLTESKLRNALDKSFEEGRKFTDESIKNGWGDLTYSEIKKLPEAKDFIERYDIFCDEKAVLIYEEERRMKYHGSLKRILKK